jgi:hypothetical protein
VRVSEQIRARFAGESILGPVRFGFVDWPGVGISLGQRATDSRENQARDDHERAARGSKMFQLPRCDLPSRWLCVNLLPVCMLPGDRLLSTRLSFYRLDCCLLNRRQFPRGGRWSRRTPDDRSITGCGPRFRGRQTRISRRTGAPGRVVLIDQSAADSRLGKRRSIFKAHCRSNSRRDRIHSEISGAFLDRLQVSI